MQLYLHSVLHDWQQSIITVSMECIIKSSPHPQHPDSLGQDPRHEPVNLVLVVHNDHHVFSGQVPPFLGVHV